MRISYKMIQTVLLSILTVLLIIVTEVTLVLSLIILTNNVFSIDLVYSVDNVLKASVSC